MRHALVAFTLAFLIPAAARADLVSAQDAFASGAYLDAARAGEARGGGDGMTVAAAALVAQSLVAPTAVASETLDRAIADGEQAIALDPKSVDARLSVAVALGLKGRRASLGEAWSRGYAQRGRRLIEEALAIAPGDARARALLGGWHLEVLRRAGPAGGLLLGAHFDRGVAAFEAARAAAPGDPAIAFHYAVALIALDSARHARQAEALLTAAATAKATNAFEVAIREEARRLGAVLATSGASAAAQSVSERFL
jgi:tetratricopeptide (TPR) repeat protein